MCEEYFYDEAYIKDEVNRLKRKEEGEVCNEKKVTPKKEKKEKKKPAESS